VRRFTLLILGSFLSIFILSSAYAQTGGVPIGGVPIGGAFSQVETEDGATVCTGFSIKVTNGDLTDNGDTCSIVTASGVTAGEWTDTGSILHPKEETVDEIVIGGTTESGADIFLGVDGAAVFNEQSGSTGDFRVESDGDTHMMFIDYSENAVGIGTSTPTHTLDIHGEVEIEHIATESGDHALDMNIDAAGFGDVKGIEIEYDTGSISAGQDEAVILIEINELDATGGEVFGLEVLSTEGSATITALKAGGYCSPYPSRLRYFR